MSSCRGGDSAAPFEDMSMKTLKRIFPIILLLILMTAVPIQAATQQKITVTAKTKSVIMVVKEQLKPTMKNYTVKWSSNKKTIVSVSNGVWTAKKKGTATLTGKYGSKSLKIKVKVERPALSRTKAELSSGQRMQIKVSGTTQAVKWSSSKTTVATVTGNGVVTAKRTGTAYIYATILGVKHKCVVRVSKAPTVVIRNTPTPTPAPIWSFTPTPTPRPTPTPIVYPGISPAPSGETAWCYIPATGKKYHKIPNCGNMNPAKARFVLITEAIARGYQKCPKCW